MNTYKIISKEQREDTLITKVEFNINDTLVVCDVNNFMVSSEDEVLFNIQNMANYQEARLNAISTMQEIKENIELNVVKNL